MKHLRRVSALLPPFTRALIALLLLVTAIETARFGLRPTLAQLQSMGATQGLPIQLDDLWRFPVSSIMHVNIFHLLSNVLLLSIVCRRLELERGALLVAVIALVAGVFAAMGAVLIDRLPGVGASGIVSAYIGAAIVFDPRARTDTGREGWLSALVMAAMTAAGMSFGAHVSGAVIGAAIAGVWWLRTHGTRSS